jgi:hypothetical protein
MKTSYIFVGAAVLGVIDSQILKCTWNTELGPLWLGLTTITTIMLVAAGIKL